MIMTSHSKYWTISQIYENIMATYRYLCPDIRPRSALQQPARARAQLSHFQIIHLPNTAPEHPWFGRCGKDRFMPFDPEKYVSQLDAIEMPQARKRELIHTLHGWAQGFVDRAFARLPGQQTRTKPQVRDSAASAKSVNSKFNSTAQGREPCTTDQ